MCLRKSMLVQRKLVFLDDAQNIEELIALKKKKN
jgi:hypothetical protein